MTRLFELSDFVKKCLESYIINTFVTVNVVMLLCFSKLLKLSMRFCIFNSANWPIKLTVLSIIRKRLCAIDAFLPQIVSNLFNAR